MKRGKNYYILKHLTKSQTDDQNENEMTAALDLIGVDLVRDYYALTKSFETYKK